jgi:hypothetical protein
MEFKSYSETRPDLKDKVYPRLELITWSEIKYEKKVDILNRLFRKDFLTYDSKLIEVLKILQAKYKRINFGDIPSVVGFKEDFDKIGEVIISILLYLDEFFFWEFLSIYIERSASLILGRERLIEYLNDFFEQYSINMLIHNNQFIPRQSAEIIEKIYTPTFKLLQDPKYNLINEELAKCFESFKSKDYEGVIRKSINSIHVTLQLLIDGMVSNSKKVSILFKEANKKELFSDYELTHKIYEDINSFLERIRMDKSDAHPTNNRADINDSIFVLNLTMVLIQNLITSFKNNSKTEI